MKITGIARSDKAWNVVFVLVGYCIKSAELRSKIICERYFCYSTFESARLFSHRIGSAGRPSVTRKAENVIFFSQFFNHAVSLTSPSCPSVGASFSLLILHNPHF